MSPHLRWETSLHLKTIQVFWRKVWCLLNSEAFHITELKHSPTPISGWYLGCNSCTTFRHGSYHLLTHPTFPSLYLALRMLGWKLRCAESADLLLVAIASTSPAEAATEWELGKYLTEEWIDAAFLGTQQKREAHTNSLEKSRVFFILMNRVSCMPRDSPGPWCWKPRLATR